ncbi:alpha-N-acetylneuraminide alpha-2,8-sialyltransferase-like [Branchiostoma floridae]|uniref:Alpha-N-acetylneuraminide alpha-2,8-sialyltransferase-like n=1 Tax=Branchiostoma floridae TaxID=7739 RepID=A0A9J7M4K5_BRAFL|nr:alpha-N-acetylneuraminide alpha-2,8-sialyltransferase-like [Branchiostoma floridae]
MKRSKCLLVVSMTLNVLLIFKEFVFLPSQELTSDRGTPDKLTFDRKVQQILEETKGDLSKLRPTEEPVWVYNSTAADIFRSELEACCNGSQNLLVTQSNTRVNTTIQYDAENKSKLNVTTEIWRKFPQKTPFGYKTFPSCTVVGNSGLLKGSGCGKQIDSADFVFRCNMAPIDERFVADVGNKANLVTMNPSIVRDRYLGLKNTTLKERFVAALSRYGGAYVWMPAFSFKMCTSRSFAVQTTLQEYKSKLSVVFGNPQFMLAMNKYWKSNGVKARRISTGLFLASAALSICGEVHLYGFWPFHVDKHNVTLTEHYYDNALPHKMHKLPDEFAKLQQLHREGIIQLRTDSCS